MSSNTYILLFLAERRVPQDAEKRIAEAAGGGKILITSDRAETEKLLGQIEIAAGDFPQELVPQTPALKWFQQWYAGADWLQRYPQAITQPFLLTNASGVHGPQMAEHLFGLLIAWYRKFPEIFAAQKKHEWARSILHKAELLHGKTLLVLGFGVIGEQVAKIAAAFGMRVIGVRRSAPDGITPNVEKVVDFQRMYEVLPEADVVVDILPYTRETHHLIGDTVFAAMKHSAVFANIGRGPTVDEAALAEAVRGGVIAGAVLDVTETEPLPPESPLWDIPGIIITPHYSGSHPQYDEMVFELFLDNLRRYRRGEELRNIVDKGLGY
ncbi:MAG: D-2-hydroxyacid dehydrogenase [Spirochaetales bacterium]|jgi:phosphoglycerate dehydrogenase-like enzyme|nr:D-2-hydroxyacid dehydrogenase [Spirochaetales bacterium]